MSPKLITKPVSTAEADRRLRPALECLFGGNENPKQALKLAAQAEAKRPGWPAARAIRALALRRLGRRAEADSVATAVLTDLEARTVPADEDAAVKLHLYYREAPRREVCSARAYEAVARACESDPYMSEASFFWHLRARDWAGAQKVATRLQRSSAARPKEEYVLWTAAAVWLGTRGGSGNPKLGALAGALVKRALTAMSVPTAEVARFATRLLCSLRDFEAAKLLMENPKIVIDASEAAHLMADIAFQGGDGALAKELLRVMLSEGDSDDWGHWVRYIELCENRGEHGTDVVDSAASDLAEELCALAIETGLPSRGQFIARLELQRRQQDWTAVRESVLGYFQRFGSKTVCAHDLRPYVLELCGQGGTEAGTLCADLDAYVVEDKVTTHINATWMRLWLGCLEDTPRQLHERYVALLSPEIESTERQEGDDYILIAAHQILPGPENTERYSKSGAVLGAILLVEAGLRQSPHNFHFKLLLVHLYKVVGAAELAVKMWMSLEVKHVQTATLSHLVARPIFEYGCHSMFDDIDKAFERLWIESERDVPESVSRAFSGGSFNAAIEFIEFRDRLERSSSMVEAVLVQTLIHINPGANADLLGVERAWDAVGSGEARFLPCALADEQPLMANEDRLCMEFWDLSLYDPARSRTDMDTPSAYEGDSMEKDKQVMVLIDLLVLRCVLRMASRVGQEDSGDMGLLKMALQNEGLGADLGHPGRRYACNLLLNVFGEGDAHSAEVNVEYFERVVEQLRLGTIAVVVDGKEAECLSPHSLAVAGRFVYETLTVTSIAIASLGMIKSKGRSKAETGALAAVYAKALISAIGVLTELVRPLGASSDAHGCRLFAKEEESVSDAVNYLQKSPNADGRQEFCNHVTETLGLIHGCHIDSATNLIKACTALAMRVKMMDIKTG